MNGRILLLSLLTLAMGFLSACNGIDPLPGTSNTGAAVTVQIVQPPPTPTVAGQPVSLVANALNDSKNAGVTWSCAPAGACGTFSPASTGYSVGTLYTPPVAPPNGPITPNLAYSVTITATSVTDTSQSASTTINIAQQYSFVEVGYGTWGNVGSVTLDGSGNVIAGEYDGSCFYPASAVFCTGGGIFHGAITPSGSSYTFDATGHGKITLNLSGCCTQTSSITLSSSSHGVIAEDDQFNGGTIGGVGSFDLQTAGPNFSQSQIAGGYSFTLTGYSGANGVSASWGGIFNADGDGNLAGGIFDENSGGGTGYKSVSFTGTYTAPDSNGRGTLTVTATPDLPGPCGGTAPTQCMLYAYYLVTPEVLRITASNNDSIAVITGNAYGQGSLSGAAATNSALSGSYIFSDFGFVNSTNFGESGAAAGQFTTDGGGNVKSGIMDLNANGAPSTSISWAGSTYLISASPRASISGPAGQTYNLYLTDPNLNVLDPNNTSGVGGGLLLETDNVDSIGIVVPQTDTGATLSGSYILLLSDQDNPPNYGGGFTGDFTTSASVAGTFSGEGDFQGAGSSNATPVVGPLTGTFSPDAANPGRFTGTVVTAPAFPVDSPGQPTDSPGTENVSYYLANGSQGFVIETDTIAPIFGILESQGTIESGTQSQHTAQQARSSKSSIQPVNSTTQHPEVSRRSR